MPLRPQTTRAREKLNTAAVALHPSCTIKGSPWMFNRCVSNVRKFSDYKARFEVTCSPLQVGTLPEQPGQQERQLVSLQIARQQW